MSFIKKIIECPEAGESCLLATHSSGLTVYITEKKEFKVNYAVFGTRYGSVDTEFALGDGEMHTTPEGIAHFLEHKLFEGEDGDAFEKYAVTGASANAYTSFDRTCYLFSCADKFFENLEILLSFVSSPYFTPETVNKEQGIIGQEIRMYEDAPGWRVLFNLFRSMYHNHPIKVEIAGTVSSISKITDKTLYDCYNTFYNPSNMFICLCGNFDTEKALQMIDEKIKATDFNPIHRSDFNEPVDIVSPYTELQMAVAMPLFMVGIKDTPASPLELTKRKATTDILLEMCVGKISPLFTKLLEDGLINTRFGSEYFYGNSYAALLFEGESKEPEKVRDAILKEIKKIAENGADPELFTDALKNEYGAMVSGFNDAEETVDEFISAAVDSVEPYSDLKILKTLTADDITLRAKELNLENTALSVVTPKN